MAPRKAKGVIPVRQSYLKSKNAVYLWSFIGANLAIFFSLVVSKGFTGSSVDHFWGRVTAKDGIIAASMPILAIVLSGVLSDLGKARVVFWRWHNPLPGCRAFTRLISSDPRIDVPALRRKLGELPRDPRAQNALWYRLYREHSTDIKISEAHRTYLLTRDMATISILFVVLFSIGLVVGSVNWRTVVPYTGALIAQYLLVASAARNYGTRFVLNVLAEESQST
jgi:hypothetical protein